MQSWSDCISHMSPVRISQHSLSMSAVDLWQQQFKEKAGLRKLAASMRRSSSACRSLPGLQRRSRHQHWRLATQHPCLQRPPMGPLAWTSTRCQCLCQDPARISADICAWRSSPVKWTQVPAVIYRTQADPGMLTAKHDAAVGIWLTLVVISAGAGPHPSGGHRRGRLSPVQHGARH